MIWKLIFQTFIFKPFAYSTISINYINLRAFADNKLAYHRHHTNKAYHYNINKNTIYEISFEVEKFKQLLLDVGVIDYDKSQKVYPHR